MLKKQDVEVKMMFIPASVNKTREGFLRKNTVVVLFFQNYAIHHILNTYLFN